MVGWFGWGAPNRYRTRGKSNELDFGFQSIATIKFWSLFHTGCFQKNLILPENLYDIQYWSYSMQAKAAVERILSISPSVRVATICDRNGKIVFTAHSKKVKNVLSRKESRASLTSAARAWKGRKSLSRKLGACKYVVAEYASVKRITMPAGRNNLLFISTTASFDHNKVIRKVRSFR